MDRSNSSPNMNDFLHKNNNSTSNLLSTSTASLRQHRLLPPTSRKHDVKLKTCTKKSKAVKIWIMKSLQVSECVFFYFVIKFLLFLRYGFLKNLKDLKAMGKLKRAYCQDAN